MIKLIKNRSIRTVFLAVVATLTFTISAIFIFNVEAQLMLKLFIVSLMGVGILMLAALCFTVLRVLITGRFKR